MPNKIKPNKTTKELFWQLLRKLEEKCGNSAGPLDAELIRASYRHWSKLEGKEMTPAYVKPLGHVAEKKITAQTVFAPGDRVKHAVFGDGTVVPFCFEGLRDYLSVDFGSSVGVKDMYLPFSYSKITRI
jgi:hypothetical protein